MLYLQIATARNRPTGTRMMDVRSWKGEMVNENKKRVVQKNPFGADTENDVEVDGWVCVELYHEARKERRGLDQNKNTENKERESGKGRYWGAIAEHGVKMVTSTRRPSDRSAAALLQPKPAQTGPPDLKTGCRPHRCSLLGSSSRPSPWRRLLYGWCSDPHLARGRNRVETHHDQKLHATSVTVGFQLVSGILPRKRR